MSSFKFNFHKNKGFSLVEVVLSLAIISISLVSLLGLFSIGLSTNQESMEKVEAANLASSLIAVRRADPLNTSSSFILPPMDVSTAGYSSSTLLTSDGELASSPQNADFRLYYQITAPTDSQSFETTKLHLILTWPPTGNTNPANDRYSYEIVTQISTK